MQRNFRKLEILVQKKKIVWKDCVEKNKKNTKVTEETLNFSIMIW